MAIEGREGTAREADRALLGILKVCVLGVGGVKNMRKTSTKFLNDIP